jgi:hypothetical protein
MLATTGISTASATTFFNGHLEESHNPGCQQCRQQVDAEPDGAAARALAHAGKHVVLVLETGGGQQRVFRLFTDHVRDVIDGHAPEQSSVVGDHCGRQQVAVLE